MLFGEIVKAAGALLGPAGRGFHIMMSVLDKGRIVYDGASAALRDDPERLAKIIGAVDPRVPFEGLEVVVTTGQQAAVAAGAAAVALLVGAFAR